MARVSIDKAYRRATNKECCCCPEDNNNILTPPTTIYSVESNVLNIIDTQGSENGIPCNGFIKQELHFSADNISYPLIIPFTGTTFDLCGVDVTLLGLATGVNTIYIKRIVEDCGGIAEYIDKADVQINCVSGSQCVIDCQPQVLYDCWNFGTDEYDIMEPNYSGNFIHAVSEVKVNGTVINFAPLNTWLDVKSLLQAYANVASVGDNVGVSTDLIFNMSTISGTISSISLKFDVIGEFPLTQLSFGDANTCTAAGAATYMCWKQFYPNVFDNTNTGTFQPNVVDIRINGASIMSGATSLSTLDDVIAMLLSDSRVIGVSNNATSEPNLDLTISTIQGVSSIVVETAAPVLITFDLIAFGEPVPCAIDHFISYRCWVKNGASNGDCAPDPCFNLTGVVVDDVYYPFSAVVNTFAEFEAEMSALPIGFAGYTYQLMTDSVFAIVLNSKKANINVGVYYDGYTYPDPDGLQLLEDFTPPQPKLTICSF